MRIVIVSLWMALGASAVAEPEWAPDEYPIGYWSGPPVRHNALATWKTVKDANFTFCGPAGGYRVEDNLRMLDFCQQVGLKALVVDRRISADMTLGDDWRETIGKVVSDYSGHAALYGYYLRDEPSFRWFSALGEISAEFLRRDPSHLPYINLFPTYASVRQLGTPTYADHLERYLRIVKPLVLSYDHYCLLQSGRDRTDYFENLELIREAGLRHATPQWNIILSTPHLGYRDPTPAEMRWQVYTSLAYGMKGLMYFTYWTSQSGMKQGRVAIVDAEGNPTAHYGPIRQLNAEVRTLGKLLLRLKSTGVFHTGEIPQGCRRLGGDAILHAPLKEPLVIGFFRDGDTDYAMIVNRDYRSSRKLTLRADPHVTAVSAVSANDGSTKDIELTKGTFTLTLKPGDGRLLRLKTAFNYPKPPEPADEINFQFEDENDLEGWGGLNSLAPLQIRDGALRTRITGGDPYLARVWLKIKPNQYSRIKVRLRVPGGKLGQIFWSTRDEPSFADDKYLDFPLNGGDDFQEVTIPVGKHAKWRDQAIRAIRLDPDASGVPAGTPVEIDYVVGEQ